jgi:hypothetical protein
MNGSTFVYIGEENAESLGELAMALKTPGNEILSSEILSPGLENCKSQDLSKKLSKKLNKQVYVSCNVPSNINFVNQEVENRLILEIKEHPDCF